MKDITAIPHNQYSGHGGFTVHLGGERSRLWSFCTNRLVGGLFHFFSALILLYHKTKRLSTFEKGERL